MTMPSHELDSVFEDINSIDGKIQPAIEAAKQAHAEQTKSNAENPGAVGPSPAQAARMAFLDSLKS